MDSRRRFGKDKLGDAGFPEHTQINEILSRGPLQIPNSGTSHKAFHFDNNFLRLFSAFISRSAPRSAMTRISRINL
ncbi:Uncharacterized protein dnm_022290 [Desulfonema magnum]|uniref:Uncharacterized protein n=1 Tax=Desulfonema magnum TaxID=45655 RepID=A0A975BIZ1_9BACT|nr:Uncharacterized protein dnm_022290 [Desulfonema magnum]